MQFCEKVDQKKNIASIWQAELQNVRNKMTFNIKSKSMCFIDSTIPHFLFQYRYWNNLKLKLKPIWYYFF